MSAFALDATYSLGSELSGVGVYSRRMLFGLTALEPRQRFRFLYRPHRLWRALREGGLPANARAGALLESVRTTRATLLHGLNQRLPQWRARHNVVTFHDLFVMTGEYSTAEFRQRFTRMAREAAERADLIITVSEFTAEQVSSLLHVERARLRPIPHGVDLPATAPVEGRLPVLLFVGAMQERKNVARIVEAFEQLDERWRLVLAGSAGFGAERIMERVRACRAANRIEVTGYVDARRLEQLYRTSSVLVFPSLDEGFGIPVLEAMAQGLPVLTSNRSALPEVCGDAAVTVDPTDTDAIAGALRDLCADPEKRARMSEMGRTRAASFSWESAVKRTWNVYRELAD